MFSLNSGLLEHCVSVLNKNKDILVVFYTAMHYIQLCTPLLSGVAQRLYGTSKICNIQILPFEHGKVNQYNQVYQLHFGFLTASLVTAVSIATREVVMSNSEVYSSAAHGGNMSVVKCQQCEIYLPDNYEKFM